MYGACNTATDSNDRPLQEVKIENSGSLPMDHPFYVEKAAAEI